MFRPEENTITWWVWRQLNKIQLKCTLGVQFLSLVRFGPLNYSQTGSPSMVWLALRRPNRCDRYGFVKASTVVGNVTFLICLLQNIDSRLNCWSLLYVVLRWRYRILNMVRQRATRSLRMLFSSFWFQHGLVLLVVVLVSFNIRFVLWEPRLQSFSYFI